MPELPRGKVRQHKGYRMKEFFDILFNIDEGICTGNMYETNVTDEPRQAPYFCVNPLDRYKDHAAFLNDKYDEHISRRADLNVTSFRNFIFEMDSIPVKDQLIIFKNSMIPFTSIVYSGSKSCHAILSVDPQACEGVHTLEGIENYKKIWRRLAAKIDREAVKLGYNYPDSKGTFIDHSCKNPSRLTRYPEFIRDNGNVQSLITLTERMKKEEFDELLEKCPVVKSMERVTYDTPVNEVDSVDDFKAVCPPELLRKLKYVDWAGAEGMYPYLYRFSLWAIDSTNVSKQAFVEFLDRYTFKSLARRGYPINKLQTAVDHAFREKGK